MTTSNTPVAQHYDLVPPGEITPNQLFVDGFEGILLGPAMSKVGFHQVINVNTQTGREQRKVVLTLAMPTLSLIEFCQRFLSNVQQNEAVLKESLKDHANLIVAVTKK